MSSPIETRPVITSWQQGMPILGDNEPSTSASRATITTSRSWTKNPRNDAAKLSAEQEKELKKELEELAVFERVQRDDRDESDPVKTYQRRLNARGVVKVFSKKDFGYRIVEKTRNETERRDIGRSNLEILKFVYGNIDNLLDVGINENVEYFASQHGSTAFRTGALSVAVDFDMFPPKIKWRTGNNHETVLLRPVVVDGVAVQYATKNEYFRPFFQKMPNNILYSPNLVLSVKPLFDIVVGFVIRGHKTVVYLPTYYQDTVTAGGLSKVDDLFAFEKLVQLGFIEFRPIARGSRRGRWFHVVSKIADEKEGVFVSSTDYKKRGPCEYQKPSEKILTPCFLNTKDHLMVLQPTIRYRVSNNKFKTITSDEILHCSSENEVATLGAQMYLAEQVELICSLCQLYPMKSLHKVSIKLLLRLAVCTGSEFAMPQMTMMDFEELEKKYRV